MTNNKSWTFLFMVQHILYTSVVVPIVASANADFENIALNKNVRQSGNLYYPSAGDIWPASNAVDGNKDCTHVDKNHYSGTASKVVPWWQVDLGNIYSISTIIVYGQRNENPVQLKGFQVYLLTSENSTDKRHIYNNSIYGNGTFKIPVQPNVFGRYVRIEIPGTYRPDKAGPLVLCEVEVYPTDIIQEHKTTVTPSMSSKSTYIETRIHWDENRAIDGVNDFWPDSCSCCSGTNGADNPWWRLELQKPYIIAQVTVYGRSDLQNVHQSSNLFFYGSNSTNENGTLLYHGNPNRNSFVYSINLRPPRLFQILTIRRWIIGLMTICEVKIFPAGCPPGLFGDKCLRLCNCRNGVACDVNTGHCDSCPTGFIGDSCQTPCHHSKYGYNCNETCNTCIQMECRNTDGKCSAGCVPGYTPTDPYCKKACPASTYGINCSQTCSTCKDKSCNNTDGLCYNDCVPGYKPDDPYCKKECDPSRYGKNCNQICSTCGGMSCNNRDGLCYKGCVLGYTPDDPYCNTKCPISTYDINCSQTCSTCKYMSCNNTDGLCLNGCVPGYKPDDPYCKKVCPASTYGKNCSQTCKTCEGMTCNNTDGLCLNGCVPGYTFEDIYCSTKCPASLYGTNCSQTCNTCKDMSCNSTDGLCFKGCVPEYNPDDPYCKTNKNILYRLRNEIKTSMSTVAGNWTSDRAVDGDTGPDPNKCQCCSGTTNAPLSWWMVDLGERVPVNGIAIYSRNNENDIRQLQGFQVILSAEATYNASSFQSKSLGMLSKMYMIKLEDVLTRYIKIQRPGVLTLCEVKVFQGVCGQGKFGHECARECHCGDNKPCNQLTGNCQSTACKPGWQGPSCNETCPPETFGDNCSDSCYCAEGTCTNNYGICPGICRLGYHGAHCNQVGTEVNEESEAKGDTTIIIGAVGASGTLLFIAVIVGIVVLKLRKRKRDSAKSEYETQSHRVSSTEIQEYDTIDSISGSTYREGPSYTNETVSGF